MFRRYELYDDFLGPHVIRRASYPFGHLTLAEALALRLLDLEDMPLNELTSLALTSTEKRLIMDSRLDFGSAQRQLHAQSIVRNITASENAARHRLFDRHDAVQSASIRRIGWVAAVSGLMIIGSWGVRLFARKYCNSGTITRVESATSPLIGFGLLVCPVAIMLYTLSIFESGTAAE